MTKIIPDMNFEDAEKYVASLIQDSDEFKDGVKPIINNKEDSSGFNKMIGVQSQDGDARVLIDEFEKLGYAFLFELLKKNEQSLIQIKNMTQQLYIDYTDYLDSKKEDENLKDSNQVGEALQFLYSYRPQEVVLEPMPLDRAEAYLARLIEQSGAFAIASKPYLGRLKKSYGYNKAIGVQSPDGKIRTRIDYDNTKGYHFNFENFNTGEKICIPINNMNQKQYEQYIDRLDKRLRYSNVTYNMMVNEKKI